MQIHKLTTINIPIRICTNQLIIQLEEQQLQDKLNAIILEKHQQLQQRGIGM